MKKVLALILALTVIFSLLSFQASAEDASADPDSTASVLTEVDPQSVQIAYDTPTAEERTDGDIAIEEEQTDPLADAASTNATSPVWVDGNLSVSKKTATIGDTVTVQVKFENSSAVNEVFLEFTKPMTGNLCGYDATFNPGTGYWEVNIAITDQTEYGTWTLCDIQVEDDQSDITIFVNYESYIWQKVDFSAADFEVVNTHPDITPPAIVAGSLSVSAKTVTGGDTVTVRVKLEDEGTIQNVQFSYQKPLGGNKYSDMATFNSVTGYWELSIDVTDKSEYGTWRLTCISVEDDKLNSVNYVSCKTSSSEQQEADLSAADFEVINTSPDITKPYMVEGSLSVSQKTATTGDTVTLRVKFEDDSAVNWVHFGVSKPMNGSQFSSTATYNSNTGYWELNINITDKTAQGTWSLYSVEAEDDQNNRTEYVSEYNGLDPVADLSAASFDVIDTASPDVTPPSLVEGSLSVSPKTVTTGDTVTFRMKFEDDSAVPNVSIVYRNNQSRVTYSTNPRYNPLTGYWEVSETIEDYMGTGTFELYKIIVSDDQWNEISIYGDAMYFLAGESVVDLSMANFEVISTSSVTGDTSGDGILNVQDLTHYINCLFDSSTGCHVKSDFNGDGEINLADVIRLLRYIMDQSIDLYATT